MRHVRLAMSCLKIKIWPDNLPMMGRNSFCSYYVKYRANKQQLVIQWYTLMKNTWYIVITHFHDDFNSSKHGIVERRHGCSITATVDWYDEERHWRSCHWDVEGTLQNDKQSLEFRGDKLRANVCKQCRKRQNERREKSLRRDVALLRGLQLVCHWSSDAFPHAPRMRPQRYLVDEPNSFVFRSRRWLRLFRDRDITTAKQSLQLIGRPWCLAAGQTRAVRRRNVQYLMETFQCGKRHFRIRAQCCWLDVFQQ